MNKEARDALDAILADVENHPRKDPQVAFLEDLLRRRYRITRLSFWRDLDPLSKRYPRIFLTIENSGPPHQQALDWTSEVEAFLFQNRIQAENPDQEAERGAHLLGQNIRWADRKWRNRGFVDSALHGVVYEDLGEVEPIRTLLDVVHVYDARASSQFADCRAYLRESIAGYANSLVVELGYDRDVASGILLLAVARMLDERFGITDRYTIFPKL